MPTLIVETVGNPDRGQNPNATHWAAPGFSVEVRDAKQASELFSRWRDTHDVGGGNLARADVMEGETRLARISYNGRIWEG
ncbi:MAG: hypothetical protein RLW87_20680 [Alphaproteobacteria bacterium]